VALAPAEQNGKGSPTIAPNGTLRFTGRLSCEKGASNVSLRAVLSGQDDAKIFSPEAQVVFPKPPPAPPKPLPPANPDAEPDPAVEEAHRKVEQTQQQLGQYKASAALTSVGETREAIEKVKAASERESLNRKVDTAILSAKVREASDVVRNAEDAFKNEAYDRAVSLAQEALDIFAKDPLSPKASETSQATALCTAASYWIEIGKRAGDPVLPVCGDGHHADCKRPLQGVVE